METKTCRKCGVEKAVTAFTVTDRHYGYRKSRCKDCEKERVKVYYATNEAYRTRAKLRARGLVAPKPVISFDEATQTKVCARCKRDLPLAKFSRQRGGRFGRLSACSECKRAEGVAVKETGRWQSWTPEGQRKYKLQKIYGISPGEYDSLLSKQKGGCALCGVTAPGSKQSVKYLMVDHDHKTGQIRGLLCAPCNMWLGNYQQLLERAGPDAISAYLQPPESHVTDQAPAA